MPGPGQYGNHFEGDIARRPNEYFNTISNVLIFPVFVWIFDIRSHSPDQTLQLVSKSFCLFDLGATGRKDHLMIFPDHQLSGSVEPLNFHFLDLKWEASIEKGKLWNQCKVWWIARLHPPKCMKHAWSRSKKIDNVFVQGFNGLAFCEGSCETQDSDGVRPCHIKLPCRSHCYFGCHLSKVAPQMPSIYLEKNNKTQ